MAYVHAAECEFSARLPLDKGFADALADYAKARWPRCTAKHAAREYDLTAQEARTVAEGSASKTTIEKIIKRADVLLGLALLADVRGETLGEVIAQLKRGHNEHAELISSLFAGAIAGVAGRSFAAGADGGDLRHQRRASRG